jgi:DNA primase
MLSEGVPLDTESVRSHLTGVGLESVLAALDRAIERTGDKFARQDAGTEEAEAGWRHALALHDAQVGLPLELRDAVEAWERDPSEEAWGRIVELQHRLARGLM